MFDEFYIHIQNQLGPTYQFLLRDDTVFYSFSTQKLIRDPGQMEELKHQPGSKEVEEFWNSLFEIGVPHWKREYMNPDIPEGPVWMLNLKYKGAEYKSQGRAAYPGSPHPAYSPEFIELIISVRRLLGWMPFG